MVREGLALNLIGVVVITPEQTTPVSGAV
jgi:hypothetical protein